jgi:hypothetical protein
MTDVAMAVGEYSEVCACECVCVCVHVHVCAYVCVRECVCVRACVRVCMPPHPIAADMHTHTPFFSLRLCLFLAVSVCMISAI